MKKEKQNEQNRDDQLRLISDQRGLSTVEYIIILVLIAVAGISLWQQFGSAVMDKIGESTSAIEDL